MRKVTPHLAWLYPKLKWVILSIFGIAAVGGIFQPFIATVAQGEPWEWHPAIQPFLIEWWPFLASVAAIILVLWGASWLAHRHEKGRNAFRLAKPARDLTSPNEIASAKMFADYANGESDNLNTRPWKNRYVPLPLARYGEVKRKGFDKAETISDEEFAGLLNKNHDVLLIGIPTSGKTRKIFEVLRTHVPDQEVLVPHRGDLLTSDLSHEAKRYLRNKDVIIVLDDLNLYASRGDVLLDLLEEISNAAKYCAIVGTCRDGAELSTAVDRELDGRIIQGSTISKVYGRFRQNLYFVRPPDPEQSSKIAQGAEIDPSELYINQCGAPGDLLLRDRKQAMKHRFEDDLSNEEKEILHAAQLLDVGTIAPTHNRVGFVADHLYNRRVGTGESLNDTLQRLEHYGFISAPHNQDPLALELAYTSLDVEAGRIVVRYKEARSVDDDLRSLIYLFANEKDVDGLTRLGIAFFQRGMYEECYQSFDHAVEKDPSNAAAWGIRGVALRALGREEKALESFDHAAEKDPSNAVTWGNRGYVLGALGREEEALESYNRAVEEDPSFAAAWAFRAALLETLDRKEEALESYNHAVEEDPSNAAVWTNWARLLYVLGCEEEALERFDYAAEVDPSNAVTWGNRGHVLHALGREEEALESYNRSLEEDPSFAAAWNNRADVLRALGREEEALQSLDRAVEEDSSFATAWANRAGMLYVQDREEEALESYNRAVEEDPSNAATWANRGHVLRTLGREEEALESFDRACALDPDYCTESS